MCHDSPADQTRVLPRSGFRLRAAEEVIQALTTGVMKPQAADLSAAQIQAIAVFLTGRRPSALPQANPEANRCRQNGGSINLKVPQWNGWGRDANNSRYQPEPGLKAEDVPKLKLKWAFAYPGMLTYGQPTIIGDRLYVTSEVGQIYCLNAQTGCTIWTINAGSGVRSAISVGPLPAGAKARFAAYFGDQKAFVHAVDAATGKPIWKTRVDEHLTARITGAPLLHANRLYAPVSSHEEVPGGDPNYGCCTFRGSVVALDAYTGKIIWKSYPIQEEPKPTRKSSAGVQMYGPAGGAIWSAPTLDLKRKTLYAGTGNSYTDVDTKGADAVVAFDLETGRIKWINQITPKDNFVTGCRPGPGNSCPNPMGPDFDFGSSPILSETPGGKQVLLAGQKSGVIYALDPDNGGKVLWQAKTGHGSSLGGIEWGPAADRQNVYVAMADTFGPADKRRPGMTALRIADGAELWRWDAPPAKCSGEARRCNNALSAAVTVIPGVVFAGSLDGHLRAYSVKDGAVIWDFDTAADTHNSVNGAPAKGGSLDAAGPTLAGGVLYVNSGYGRFGGMPGNALLAFTVDGR